MSWGEARNRVFDNGDVVQTDGGRFFDCDFRLAELRYGGGPLPEFHNCRFGSVSWRFTDQALRTIQFLQTINASPGGPEFLADLFQPGKLLKA